jgi:hypothetical protein
MFCTPAAGSVLIEDFGSDRALLPVPGLGRIHSVTSIK